YFLSDVASRGVFDPYDRPQPVASLPAVVYDVIAAVEGKSRLLWIRLCQGQQPHMHKGDIFQRQVRRRIGLVELLEQEAQLTARHIELVRRQVVRGVEGPGN